VILGLEITFTIMKTFNVVWLEKHSVNVDAKNEEEACAKVLSGDYDEAAAEFEGEATAYEMKLK
jgi:hypothetical protein